MIGGALIQRLCDRRRWRAARVALTFDSMLLAMHHASDGRPTHDTIVAVGEDDHSWSGMAELAEQLPDAISARLFTDMDEWVGGAVTPAPEPDPVEQMNPRRLEAMRDVALGSSFIAIAVRADGAHAATALMATEGHRDEALRACERLVEAFRDGRIDDAGSRFEWDPQNGGSAE